MITKIVSAVGEIPSQRALQLESLHLASLLAYSPSQRACSASQSSDPQSDKLVLVHQDNTNHAVVVEISRGEKVVYSEGRTLASESSAQLESFTQNGEYRVAVTVDGQTAVKTSTFPDDDSATMISIDNDGDVTINT